MFIVNCIVQRRKKGKLEFLPTSQETELRIRMFLGLPDQDPLEVGIRILLSSSKSRKKKPSFLLFCDFCMPFNIENDVNAVSKSNK
jgi:hypothetical protein